MVIHCACLCTSEASTKLRHTHCQCQHMLVLTFLWGNYNPCYICLKHATCIRTQTAQEESCYNKLQVWQRPFPSTFLGRLTINSSPSSLSLSPGSWEPYSSSFIILITVQANVICGVSHFASYADFYLIAGTSQSHFNDAQTAELLKQTQRQPSVKELESAEETGLEHCRPPPSAGVRRSCGCCSGRPG